MMMTTMATMHILQWSQYLDLYSLQKKTAKLIKNVYPILSKLKSESN